VRIYIPFNDTKVHRFKTVLFLETNATKNIYPIRNALKKG